MDDDEEEAGIPEWVVTFGDMMSLLLTFFIMLVSMSEIKEEERFQMLLESMRRKFGPEASMVTVLPGKSTPANSSMNSVASTGRAKRKDLVRGGNPVKSVSGEDNLVQIIRPGQDTTVGGTVFFEEDSTELDDEARQSLRQIAAQIAGKPQKVEIRGHTSRKPVGPGNGDHWALAYRRCRAAMDFLIEQGINQERIRLGSAGAHEPLDEGEQEKDRKRNARVEVLMWDEPIGVSQNG